MKSELQSRLPYLAIVIGILILDRWTKSLIQARFSLNESLPVIDGLFSITYVQNTGVAFGIFSTISSPAKAVLLSLFTAIAAIAVAVFSVRSPAANRLLQVALGCILGGALGNLFDRSTLGYVVDFLELYYSGYHWPAFNVADSAITFGVALLTLELLRNEVPQRA